jgi:DNA polymerase-3 subunit delta
VIYLIHGEEEFLRSRHLAEIRQKAGAPDLVTLNTTELDGDHLTLGELQNAADAVPFLCEHRLVIVHGWLKRLGGRDRAGEKGEPLRQTQGELSELERLLSYLDRVPPTTELIFSEAQQLGDNHLVLRHLLSLAESGKARVHLCQAPRPRDLPQWVNRHARAKGAAISPDAATALADAIGPDLRLMDVELEKLITYAGRGRRIEVADVEEMVPYAQAGNVFKLADAIAERRAGDAFALLHQLRESGAAAPYLLTMIDRQFRILLQVSELTQTGLPPEEIAPKLRLRDFMVKRAIQQARHWTTAEIIAAFDLLLSTDLAIKTGQADEDTALDLILVDLLSRSRPQPAGQPSR